MLSVSLDSVKKCFEDIDRWLPSFIGSVEIRIDGSEREYDIVFYDKVGVRFDAGKLVEDWIEKHECMRRLLNYIMIEGVPSNEVKLTDRIILIYEL